MTEIFEPLTKGQSWDGVTFDKIALLFLVIAIGALFDFNTEERHTSAYRFYKTGSGTLGMSEFMESPSVVVVQALASHFYSGPYHSLLVFPEGGGLCVPLAFRRPRWTRTLLDHNRHLNSHCTSRTFAPF
jgi:hypothetical protein